MPRSDSAGSCIVATTRSLTAWWKEERGESSVFLDYNQNLRDRSVASVWSVRARAGAPVSTPMTWQRLAETTSPQAFNVSSVPDYLADGDPWAAINEKPYDLTPLLDLWESLPGGELNWPAGLPEDARRTAPRAAFQEGRRPLGRRRQPHRKAQTAGRLANPQAD